jgi:hypothetical protein
MIVSGGWFRRLIVLFDHSTTMAHDEIIRLIFQGLDPHPQNPAGSANLRLLIQLRPNYKFA